ncbi:MAG: SDR family oxidoreductase [Eubacteriales bacterium]
MNRLNEKVAVITGGNSGVGEEIAKLFAQQGAKVVISARRVEPLEKVAMDIKEAGGEVLCVPTDVSKEDEVATLMKKTIETFGKIDILINNAGVLEKGLLGIGSFKGEDFDKLIGINTKGAMFCMREALAYMQEGGAIVNIDSVAGMHGIGGASYVASKAAMVGITKHTALVYADKKIRCNAICPGTIVTPMTAAMDPNNLDVTVMGSVMKHNDLALGPCMPSDIASIVLFLASDESRAITGQTLVADFGSTL